MRNHNVSHFTIKIPIGHNASKFGNINNISLNSIIWRLEPISTGCCNGAPTAVKFLMIERFH